MENRTGFRAVFVRECWRIAKSKIYIWGVICAALLSLGILMFLMNKGLPQKMPIAVVDLDNTSTTRTLIRQLDAFPRADIKYKSLSFKEARKKMESMEIYAFLTIPKDFTADAQSGNQPKLVYYTNNAFMISGSLLFQDLKIISTLASASVGLKTGMAKGMSETQIMPVVSPIKVEAHMFNEPDALAGVLTSSSYNPDKGQVIQSCSAGVKGATQRERTCLPYGTCLDGSGNGILTPRATFNAGSGIVDNIVTQFNDTSIFSGLVNRCEGDDCKPKVICPNGDCDPVPPTCTGPTCSPLDGFNTDKRINPLSWIEH